MNKLFLCLLFTVLSVKAFSQRVYFIYLQSEQEQPFFVKMNDRVYSSSSSGYLILSKLRDSSYHLSVGFPQGKGPEQKFALTVRGKDQGFLLKNFESKGWGLFDLQTLSVQMATAETVKEPVVKTEAKDVSVFTDILAKAADDSTLREKPVVAKIVEKKPEEKLIVTDTALAKRDEPKREAKDTLVTRPAEIIEKPVVKTEPPQTEVKEQIMAKTEEPKAEIKEPVMKAADQKPATEVEYKKSIVTRRSESSTTEGFGLTFIDQHSDGSKDTISILIPNPKPVVNPVKELPKEEKKFLDISTDTAALANPVTEVQPVIKKEEPKAEVKQPVADTMAAIKPVAAIRNNCKEVAVEADFLKLRKAMAAVETDDEMLDEAKKYFKTKCFTTLQVKNIGALFLTDAGKYRFFDLAYSYVSDAENFGLLQSELKEEYFINRFRAMLRN